MPGRRRTRDVGATSGHMASPLFRLCSVRAGKTTEDIHRRPQLTSQVKGMIANAGSAQH